MMIPEVIEKILKKLCDSNLRSRYFSSILVCFLETNLLFMSVAQLSSQIHPRFHVFMNISGANAEKMGIDLKIRISQLKLLI